MIKYILPVIFVVLFSCRQSYSQYDTIQNQKINYYNLELKIDYGYEGFFSGLLGVKKDGKEIYRLDSTFTNYYDHRIIDLNSDGSDELVLFLSEGASPYIFQNMLIFDIKRSDKPVYLIANGYLDTTTSKRPRILVNQRLSPSVLGLWCYWLLEYRDNELVLPKMDKVTRNFLTPDVKSIKENLDDYYSSGDVCNDYTYNVFFENIFISYTITGEQYKAIEFFNKNYKCPEKIKNLVNLKQTARDTYNYIKQNINYIYSEY